MDYSNWTKERESLKAEIMKELREQRDRRGNLTLDGTYKFMPQLVPYRTNQAVVGPIMFGTSFKRRPAVGFSNLPTDNKRLYLVQPYVASWNVSEGLVAGFYLGLYALNDAPFGLDSHIIGWIASGLASYYRPNPSRDGWAYQYDLSKATHLES